MFPGLRCDQAGPCILMVDLDPDDIARGKYDLVSVGHYARPDAFQLHVNLRSTPAVKAWNSAEEDPFSSKPE